MYGYCSDIWMNHFELSIHRSDQTLELRCMVAEVRSDGCRRGCFSGCQGADEWVRLYTPNTEVICWQTKKQVANDRQVFIKPHPKKV